MKANNPMKTKFICAALSVFAFTCFVLVPAARADCVDSGLIQNEGFEAGDFTGWVIDDTNNPPLVTNANSHSGSFSALAGNINPQPEPTGDSSFYQQFTVPAGGGMLSFWHWDYSTDSIQFDWQDAYITATF